MACPRPLLSALLRLPGALLNGSLQLLAVRGLGPAPSPGGFAAAQAAAAIHSGFSLPARGALHWPALCGAHCGVSPSSFAELSRHCTQSSINVAPEWHGIWGNTHRELRRQRHPADRGEGVAHELALALHNTGHFGNTRPGGGAARGGATSPLCTYQPHMGGPSFGGSGLRSANGSAVLLLLAPGSTAERLRSGVAAGVSGPAAGAPSAAAPACVLCSSSPPSSGPKGAAVTGAWPSCCASSLVISSGQRSGQLPTASGGRLRRRWQRCLARATAVRAP